MIRVAVILAAFVQLPLVALAQTGPTPAPAKRVSDAYYAKRQQERSAASPSAAAASPDDVQGEEQLGAAEAGGPSLVLRAPADAQPATATAAFVDPRSTNPYYAQRYGAITRREAVPGAPTHYAATTAQQYATQEAPATETIDGGYVQGDGDGCVEGCGEGCVGGCGEDCDGSCGGQCDGGRGPMGLGCMMAAVQAVPTTNVLWNELYSCRKWWVGVDYLGMWAKGNHIPPLVTTSPIGTSQTQAGVLGQPGTSILFGNQRILNDMRSGARITGGVWLVGDVLGIEANYYALGPASTNYSAASTFSNGSTSDPILARPYFNPAPPILSPPPPHPALPPQQSAVLLAYPNFTAPGIGAINLDGTVHVASKSDIQSAGVLLQRLVGVNLARDHRMFLVGGYRWFRVEEGLQITDTVNLVGGGLPSGTGFTHFDSFGTRNIFNGGDIGLFSDLRRGRYVFETTAKIAIGDMAEVVNIDGQTKVNNGTTIVGYPGGVLTQASNIGVYHRNQFAVIPEFNFKLGYQITQGFRATLGYNFTYISRVARPGNEIDTVVNPPYTPGATQIVARPQYLDNPTSMWLQGFTAGFEYRW